MPALPSHRLPGAAAALRRRACQLFLPLMMMLLGAPALALAPELLYQMPEFSDAQLSPDGTHLAVKTPLEQRVQLLVIELDSRRTVARISFPDADIGTFMWLGTQRLVFNITQQGQSRRTLGHSGGLFVIGRDGKEQRQLFQTTGEWLAAGRVRRVVQFWPVQPVPGSEDELIVGGNDVDEHSIDLYRLDVRSGKRQHLSAGRPPRIHHWVLDARQQPRAAVGSEADSTTLISYYRDEQGRWQTLWRGHSTGGSLNLPLAMEPGGGLLVSSNEGRDTMSLREYDPQRRQWGQTLIEHPHYDVGFDARGSRAGGLVFEPGSAELKGLSLDADRPLPLWFDADRQALQALVDRALPGQHNRLDFSAAPARVLVHSSSDRQPLRWYLLEPASGRLKLVLESRPQFDAAQMPATEIRSQTTADGQRLLSYRLRPPGAQPGQALPTVLIVHGGPWDRGPVWGDDGGDMRDAQWLALQGYQVLLPSFRGSTGFGKRWLHSARGEFGRAMQDDLEFALQALIDRGEADAQRLCIMGASYGGYAALMAVANHPERYRCALAGLPISDLVALLESGASDLSTRQSARRFWTEMVGDPKTQAEALRAVSPLTLADRIRAGVMIYAGIDDQRTPLEQAEAMREALRRAGREPVWLAKYGEGHGFFMDDNRRELRAAQRAFLRQQLGAPPAAAPASR